MPKAQSRDFFQWQTDSRFWSLLFVLVFVLSSLIWLLVIYQGLDLCISYYYAKDGVTRGLNLTKLMLYPTIPGPDISRVPTFVSIGSLNIPIALIITVAFGLTTFGSSLYRVWRISQKGSTYLTTALGGIPLGETESVLGTKTGSERERIFRNVVKEMALAAHAPEPDLYILPNENGVNAMAVGLDPEDAAIMITKGTLKYLNREELSGVIGHEFSHILNGDMRHNTLMAGWLHGFFSLTSLGLLLFRGVSRNPILIPAGLFLIVVGFLGDLCGRIIQAAFNRRRESMADAYSTQFTRDPQSLAAALIKIGGLSAGSYVKTAKRSSVDCRHLFIAESIKSVFLTHPPLATRIWALDPTWDGQWHDFLAHPVDLINEAHEPVPLAL
ncbi:MAG: M48 family metalloprotease [Deltaproteobacteria bacterium]|jgi:Zn-dependent protease with chaperone function|nr:M48 family metalloprotease [Deltaproteobacteria bacterium]